MRISIPTDIANSDTIGVKNYSPDPDDPLLVFTFKNFHLAPIMVNKEFNNYYESSEQYIEKMTILLDKALPLLSDEKVSLFSGESRKASSLHLHKITNKREIVERILKEYGFTSRVINEMFEGDDIYQLEVPYANGATRIVFQRIENLISFLFVDPNHHVYFNPRKVEAAGSLYFDFCPVNAEHECERMDYLGTCYAFEFLDEEKYNKTFSSDYDPTKQ